MSKQKETRRAVPRQSDQHGGHNAGGRTRSSKSHDNRSTQTAQIIGHGYSPEQLRRGKLTLSHAMLWRKFNADAWGYIVRLALDLVARGEHFGAQYLVECVRSKAFVDSFGNDTKTNNSFAPIFARWLVLEHPETRPFIELRRSVYDVLIGGRDD